MLIPFLNNNLQAAFPATGTSAGTATVSGVSADVLEDAYLSWGALGLSWNIEWVSWGATATSATGTAAGTSTASAVGVAIFAAPDSPYPKPAGRPKRRRYVVNVDGEDFVVESVEEAQALLSQAVQTAEEVAPAVVRKYRRIAAKRKAPETRVPVPMLSVSDDADAALRALVERMQRDIEAAYERAARNEELRLYLAARAKELDEEEAAALLL